MHACAYILTSIGEFARLPISAQRLKMAPLPIHREAKTRPEHDTLLQSHLLVASFLSAQGYTSTLASFRLEAGAIFASASETRAPTKEVDLREVVDDYLEKKMRSLQVKEEESELEEQVARLSVKEDWLPTQVAEVRHMYRWPSLIQTDHCTGRRCETLPMS